jgi:hypothetical protein
MTSTVGVMLRRATLQDAQALAALTADAALPAGLLQVPDATAELSRRRPGSTA